jgi:uncharacterized protein YecT (DUF1311 family)
VAGLSQNFLSFFNFSIFEFVIGMDLSYRATTSLHSKEIRLSPMDTRQLVALIAQRKGTWDSTQTIVHYTCKSLIDAWEKERAAPGFIGDIYPVRAISLLQVFTRSWVCTTVNSSTHFAERGIALVQNTKPDYKLVLSITNEVVTFGDIVAHTVSVSNLQNVLSIFGILCAKELPSLLRSVVDRWAVEVEGKPSKPIIDDYDAVCSDCAKLFELRHMVCHELPRLGRGSTLFANVAGLMMSLASLIHALEEVLTQEVFGNVPLTQTDMNLAAIKEYEVACGELSDVLAQLREKHKTDTRRLQPLNATQSAWERYRKLQATFRHDPVGGGSIGPMLRAHEGKDLTEERTKRLRGFLNAEEGWL